MKNIKMGSNFDLCSRPESKSTDRNGRASVEVLVALSAIALMLTIFALVSAADYQQRKGSPARTGPTDAVATLQPHEAITFPSAASPTNQQDATTTTTTTRVVRNGVTVETPPLLVPVVVLDEAASRQGEQASGTLPAQRRQFSATRKHRHHVARTYSRRKTEYQIVGLSANRRLIAIRR